MAVFNAERALQNTKLAILQCLELQIFLISS